MTDVLYGARGGNVGTSNLYTLDPNTGAIDTTIGPIGFALSGLAFDPTDGTLYGVTSNNSSLNPRSLITIDPLTGAGTLVGPLGLPGGAFDNCSDIAFTADGQLWGADSLDVQLVSIDKLTGAGTFVGTGGGSGFGGGLAVDPNSDVMYWWRSPLSSFDDIYTVDPSTGVYTNTGVLGDDTTANINPIAAMAIDNSGVLWLIGNDANLSFHAVLEVADVVTGHVVMIGDTGTVRGAGPLDAIAWLTTGPRFTVSATPTSGIAPLAVAFTATVISGTVLSWDWDFDDGDTSTLQNPSHTFTAFGTYTVTVVAHGADGDTTRLLTITVTVATPTQVFGGSRFYEAPPWRVIVGDLEDNTLTFLDRLALDRSVTVTRAAARVISGRVPSDNPEVNIPAPPPDDEPFVSVGIRLVSCFRREAPSGSNEAPWVIRARGIVLNLEDDADTDHATSTFTAYDPWKYWYRRPVLNAIGEVGDVSYIAGTRASDIIIDQFSVALAFGPTILTDFGQTGFYAGTIENTAPIPDGGDGLAITFRAGTTLGEMCDLLVATGTCDIVNDPIYDIANRPGLLTETSIYNVAGEFRANAVMGWDRWPRSVVQLSRQVDGTERANLIQMFAGQGGPPVPLEQDATSIARFRDYWATQYLPGVPSLAGAHLIAQRQLALLKDGQYTYALSPASERAPLLFEEYREADTVPVYASDRFRDPISGVPVRIESIPIVIGDDQLERVNQMLVSFAPESGS